jgi:predicted ArsR family transcriptional regulator
MRWRQHLAGPDLIGGAVRRRTGEEGGLRTMDTEGAGSRRALVLETLRASPGPLTIAEIAGRLGVHRNTARFHVENLVSLRLARELPAAGPPPAGGPAQRYTAIRTPRVEDGADYRALAEILAEHLSLSPDPAVAAQEAGRRWARRTTEVDRGGAADGGRAEGEDAGAEGDADGEGDAAGKRLGRAEGRAAGSVLSRLVATLGAAGFDPVVRPTGGAAGAGSRTVPVGVSTDEALAVGAPTDVELAVGVVAADGCDLVFEGCPFLELARRFPAVVCSAHLGLMQGVLEREEPAPGARGPGERALEVRELVVGSGARECIAVLGRGEEVVGRDSAGRGAARGLVLERALVRHGAPSS